MATGRADRNGEFGQRPAPDTERKGRVPLTEGKRPIAGTPSPRPPAGGGGVTPTAKKDDK